MTASIPTAARLAKFHRWLVATVPKKAGKVGESCAKAWMESKNWTYCVVDQSPGGLALDLRQRGAKRPDFLYEAPDGGLYLLDAKYVKTKGATIFWMTIRELDQYRALQTFVKEWSGSEEVWVLFMVIPKEHDGRRLVWVDLDEFSNAEYYKDWSEPAMFVSLEDRPELWSDVPP